VPSFLARVRRTLLFWAELTLAFLVVVGSGAAVFYFRNRLDRTPAQIEELGQGETRASDGTAYWTKGNTGPNLVLVHGVLASKYTFEALKPYLSSRFRLWAYDVRGMGFTPGRGDVGLDGQVQQLKAFVDEMKLAPLVLLGHSTGGGIAQAFAARYPALVRQLILVDTMDFFEPNLSGNWESTNLRDLVYASLRSPYLPKVMPWLSGRWITKKILSHQYAVPGRITNTALLEHSYPMRLPGYWDRASEWLGAPSAEWLSAMKASFSTAPFPVSVLWGINDAWFFPRQGQQVCERYRACSFLLIEDAGHLPHEEQPERFSERLLTLVF
jgi:pimeloyl-ACP methyl ester carboxylesterase